MARDILSKVQKGLVVIAGPAKASAWDITDSKWDEKAKLYMSILGECGHPIINCQAPYENMQIDRENYDFHFVDTPHNCVHMCSLVTSLACFVQLTSNLVNLSVMSNLTSAIEQPAGREAEPITQPAGREAEQTQLTDWAFEDTSEEDKAN